MQKKKPFTHTHARAERENVVHMKHSSILALTLQQNMPRDTLKFEKNEDPVEEWTKKMETESEWARKGAISVGLKPYRLRWFAAATGPKSDFKMLKLKTEISFSIVGRCGLCTSRSTQTAENRSTCLFALIYAQITPTYSSTSSSCLF